VLAILVSRTISLVNFRSGAFAHYGTKLLGSAFLCFLELFSAFFVHFW
jgi:hypothetical protein